MKTATNMADLHENAEFAITRNETWVVDAICEKTGFEVDLEVFRGTVYDTEKVGTIILAGAHEGAPAILKIQGIAPPSGRDESEMHALFATHGLGGCVRPPRLITSEPWSEERGYGWMLMEQETAPKLFTGASASVEERESFCAFYQDYREHAAATPWFENPHPDMRTYVGDRVAAWRRLTSRVGRFREYEFAKDVMRFLNRLSVTNDHPMVFCHGHLSSKDVAKKVKQVPRGREYIVFSNAFWGWRPAYYDLAFNVWVHVMAADPLQTSPLEVLNIVKDWVKSYRAIPILKDDEHFNDQLALMLEERFIGTLLADLSGDRFRDMVEAQQMATLVTSVLDQLGELETWR